MVEAPKWLLPHFNATIDTLHEYYAGPMSLNNANKHPVSIMWACQSVMDIADIPRPPSSEQNTECMKFLTEACTDFSDCGWGRLFRGCEVHIEKVPGANHFAMMEGDFAPKLASFIYESL